MSRFPLQIISIGKKIEFLGRPMDDIVSTIAGESYFTFFQGSGLEFKGHREYTLQDDSRNIDWKASLRADKLLIKEFYQERGMDIVFVYDVSDTMLFGSHKKLKAHYGAEFILALAGAAIESDYNVGLICFNNKIQKYFEPSSAGTQVGLFFDVLGNHATYGGEYDLVRVLEFIDATLSPGNVVVIVSDFLGNKIPFDSFKNQFKQLSVKFDVISVILRDPRDEFMPSDNINIVVSDPQGKRDVLFNPAQIKHEYESYAKEQKIELRKFLKDVKSNVIELYTDKSFIDPTISFFMGRGAIWK
ncbi:DUF58 domain-containing protein [archaeon]|nr:DUF58 domain-containing protein [archaeon]